MEEKMSTLCEHDREDLQKLPKGKNLIGCRWVFFIKYHDDGTNKCLKPILLKKNTL